MNLLRTLKNSLVPEPAPRRLLGGPGRGLTLELDLRHHTGLWLGLYEMELVRHLRRLCRPGTPSFDVGGSFGYDALLIAKQTAAPVVTFEASPAAADRLRRNVALNPRAGAYVEVMEAFVGSEKPNVLLDEFAEASFTPGFLKIDVDGAELDVLKGASRLLKAARPSLIVETHEPDLERDCGHLLHELGYRLTVVNQRRVLRDHRPIPHNRWLVAESA